MIDKIAQINAAVSGFIWGVPAMICIICEKDTSIQ